MLSPDQFYGKGMESLFPGGTPKTGAPFPRAGRRKDVRDYDAALVHKTLSAPPQLESIDPRMLHATQPNVTRAGVEHYMGGGRYETHGETFADRDDPGNRYPVIYSRKSCEDCPETHMLLSGHHRATAALLEGRDVHHIRVRGGYGPPRR